MRFIIQPLQVQNRGYSVAHLMLGALLVSACTVSNDKAGGVENEVVQQRNDAPSPESVALWADPGPNLLAALSEVEANDATTVQGLRNIVLGVMSNEAGAYYSAAVGFQPNTTTYRPRMMQCQASILPDAVTEACAALSDPELRLAFIDETPNFAQHRVFGREILQCARDAGFNYLAVEALEESGQALAERGFVSRTQSGRFMREPQLAGLVEDGMDLGLVPIGFAPYDLCTDCALGQALGTDARARATSLEEQTLNVDPEAKVLVWAGYGQAYKQPWGRAQPYVNTLASYVYADTGIEPYSIVQMTVAPNTTFGPNQESGMYLASGPNNGSCSGAYSPGSSTGMPTHNAVVFHVAPAGDAGGSDSARWAWLHTPAAERMAVTPTCASCAAGERLLVQAFPPLVDISDRVPSDQALCQAGASCELALPAGDYQLVVWSEAAQLTSATVTLSAGTSIPVSMN
jgi:hypothetical protein